MCTVCGSRLVEKHTPDGRVVRVCALCRSIYTNRET